MREFWIDRWKGLLILLVVLGHVVGAGGNLATLRLVFSVGVYMTLCLTSLEVLGFK